MRDEMISRVVYSIAGICASYMAASPLLSGYPGRPVWNSALFLASAVCLIMAATILRGKAQGYFALFGSGLIAFVFAYLVVLRFYPFVTHARIETRLIAVQETWFDQWRVLLDRPVTYALLASALLSLLLSLPALRSQRLSMRRR